MNKNKTYNDGDIVIATIAPPASGLLYHKGIVMNIKNDSGEIIPHVFHNTPMKVNKYGGNVVLETLDTFINDGREIIEVQESVADIEEIVRKNDILRKRKFDWVDFNCEHYVTYVTKGEMKSLQLHRYIFIAIIGTTTFFFIRFIRKVNNK